MEKNENYETGNGADAGRRKLLKAAATAGAAALAWSALPGGWTKPVAKLGALPAHAQMSDTAPRLTNLRYGRAANPAADNGMVFDSLARFDYDDPLGGVNGGARLTASLSPCTVHFPPGTPLRDVPYATWEGPSSGEISFPFNLCSAASFELCVELRVDGRTSNQLCRTIIGPSTTPGT